MTMNLKDLTWENHKKAERKEFASILMSGKISPSLYYRYLTNQYYSYVILEARLRDEGFPPELYSVFRAEAIREDLQELENEYEFIFNPANLTPSQVMYSSYIEGLDYNGLVAHMYVRHFGDMYGGAMIQKRVPGSGRMYDFEDKETLKAKLREMLTDDMADEANRCFEFAIKLFEELTDGE
jgi:heme oxygenase